MKSAARGKKTEKTCKKGSGEKGFFDRVYHLVQEIPAGKVMTYGQISRLLKRPHAAKFVGYAMASAPEHLGLPCHRVVNRLGQMAAGTIFGGEAEQRKRLLAEGVSFLENGRVDLGQSLFDPGCGFDRSCECSS